jgi:GT2 family glycosyltransferase/glycosyltransferase involved in cell wall biosynthesis
MFEKLPSLRGFQPKWFTGGATRFYLPLLYDVVFLGRPKLVVTVGFGDGQAHFAFCQAAKEADLKTRCVAIRSDVAENDADDEPWMRGEDCGKDTYAETSELISGSCVDVARSLSDSSIDVLFIDEINSGAALRATMADFQRVLSPRAVVIFHGLSLDRAEPPGTAWKEWATGHRAIDFSAGIGLGVASARAGDSNTAYDWLFNQERATDLRDFYLVAAERMEAQKLATLAARENAALNARQVWLESILADRATAQRTLDEQAKLISEFERRLGALQRDREVLQQDRSKAQLVMESQAERLKQFEALHADRVKAQMVMEAQAEQLALLEASRRELTEAQKAIDEHARQLQEFEASQRDLEKAQQVIGEQAEQLERFETSRRELANAQRVIDEQAERLKRLETAHRERSAAQLAVEAQAEQLQHFDALRRDRAKAQAVIDAQAEQLEQFDALRRDRAQAQLVMDAQLEQLKQWTATAHHLGIERDKFKRQAKEQKELLKLAKSACRRSGKCFRAPKQDAERKKQQRPLAERILREIKRIPRNLLGASAPVPPPVGKAPSVDVAIAPISKTAPADKTAGAEISPIANDRNRYAEWIARHEPDSDGLEAQRSAGAQWRDSPKISLLTPVFDTPARFLEEMIASVLAQTYPNWELCIVDAGSTSAETLAVLQNEAFISDTRIRIEQLPENLGIAENSNRALAMATGDFIACLDHDDLLAPFALYEVARVISQCANCDVIYSDEDRWSADGHRHAPFFKPEWSPEFLCSSMYIGHLTAYRRACAAEMGGFRKEFDLSQDYDFALRATDSAREIRHIPQVLYHWREHPASGSTGGKPNARKTNLAALGDAMRRRNLPAQIIEYPTANRARLAVQRWPRVSIIVPTDSPSRAQICATELLAKTKYPDLEVVIVTNATLAEKLESSAEPDAPLRIVRYAKPFNFSDKCNVGVDAASGERLIFFNDDVEPVDGDWIQELTEQLENPAVGAVAPKMLYESGKIQHAGLVTGVRGLVGTACHQWPADSPDYWNFAQSLRDVSALSAACLAMRKDDFLRVGRFDEINTPIAHSDLDLCFKIRDAGLRCVYTPFVTMNHRGHASIGAVEQEEHQPQSNKASAYLLKRWAGYTCRDPYFPDNVRDWLYLDSPTPIRMFGRNQRHASEQKCDLLFVTHDLSWSGAPLILLHIAKWCQQHGFFVAVMSPEEGPLQDRFAEAGIPVIVDSLVTKGHPSFSEFAREFDCVVASTIFGAPVILSASSAGIPHLWWIHEGRVAEHYLNEDRDKRSALRIARMIVTPDTRSAQIYQPFTDRSVRILNYGIPDPPLAAETLRCRDGDTVRFLVLGTIEHRKGQRVLLEALRKLPEEVMRRAEFRVVGRRHDSAIAGEIEDAARECPQLSYMESVTHEEALRLIANADVMVSASWDETGPLILMEALALGKPILSTNVGAVAEHLMAEESGLFFKPGDSSALAAAVVRLMSEPALIEQFGVKSRVAYEKYFTFERFAERFADLVREAAVSQYVNSAAVS